MGEGGNLSYIVQEENGKYKFCEDTKSLWEITSRQRKKRIKYYNCQTKEKI